MFSSLRAKPEYNRILISAIDIASDHGVLFKVYYIPGVDNVIADSLSRFQNATALLLAPKLSIGSIYTSRMRLGGGGVQKMIPTALARQPTREPWPMDRLIHERSILLGTATR